MPPTIASIRASEPGTEWATLIEDAASEPTDTWRLRDGGTPGCFRSTSERAEWSGGAWAPVRGDPDETSGCLSQWRNGYNWVARHAMTIGGLEVWKLALREIEERRPIGRCCKGGARYSGQDHETVPSHIAGLDFFDVAVWKSLHGMQGSLLRWEIYRQLGASDADLALAISREYGTVSSGQVAGVYYTGHGCKKFNDHNGQKHASFGFGDYGREKRLSDANLVDRARQLLRLRDPAELRLWTTPPSSHDPIPDASLAGHHAVQLAFF